MCLIVYSLRQTPVDLAKLCLETYLKAFSFQNCQHLSRIQTQNHDFMDPDPSKNACFCPYPDPQPLGINVEYTRTYV